MTILKIYDAPRKAGLSSILSDWQRLLASALRTTNHPALQLLQLHFVHDMMLQEVGIRFQIGRHLIGRNSWRLIVFFSICRTQLLKDRKT